MCTKIVVALPNDEANQFKSSIRDNDGYCPCSLVKTPDTKCMCKEFREMESGTCHCGLYKKVIIE